jgi:hypothetical protein
MIYDFIIFFELFILFYVGYVILFRNIIIQLFIEIFKYIIGNLSKLWNDSKNDISKF